LDAWVGGCGGTGPCLRGAFCWCLVRALPLLVRLPFAPPPPFLPLPCSTPRNWPLVLPRPWLILACGCDCGWLSGVMAGAPALPPCGCDCCASGAAVPSCQCAFSRPMCRSASRFHTPDVPAPPPRPPAWCRGARASLEAAGAGAGAAAATGTGGGAVKVLAASAYVRAVLRATSAPAAVRDVLAAPAAALACAPARSGASMSAHFGPSEAPFVDCVDTGAGVTV